MRGVDPYGLATAQEVRSALRLLKCKYPGEFQSPPGSVSMRNMGDDGLGMTDWNNNIYMNSDRFGDDNAPFKRGDEYQFLQTLTHEMLHVNEGFFSRLLSNSFRTGNPLGYFHRQLDDKADSMITRDIIDEYEKNKHNENGCGCNQ